MEDIDEDDEDDEEDGEGDVLEEDEIEDDDLKIAMELSLVELIENLKISLPEEPSESEPNAINISIKEGNRTFERRFKKTDKIKDLKNYLTIKVRTFNYYYQDKGKFTYFYLKVLNKLG